MQFGRGYHLWGWIYPSAPPCPLPLAGDGLVCGLLARFPPEIWKISPDPPVSWCLETSSITTPFPGWVSVPNSFVSLFIFYILSYLLSKTMGCFSGCLMSSASDKKLFCGVCSAFKCSFDEFVGEKVVSPSYSSSILAPISICCFSSYCCCCSVILLFLTLWDPKDCSTTDFPVLHHLP